MSGRFAERAPRWLAPALGAALLLGLPAPAMAQSEAPPASVAEEAVVIPFAPPLGTPVTYALRFERKRPSGDSVIEFEQRLTFERLGSGYLMRLETLSFASGGRRFELADKRVLDAVPPALRIYLLPMAVELDSSGEMVRMRDWEAMRAGLRSMPEAAAALSGAPLDEAALAAMQRLLDPIINASAEEGPALMIRGWPALLGYGGGEFVLGEPVEVDTEVTGGLLPGAVPATMQGVVTRTAEGHLRLIQTARFDPQAMRAATLAMIGMMRTAGAGSGRAAAGEETIESLQITDEVEIAFDPLTGLPVNARTARVTSVVTSAGSAVGGEVLTLRRITP
ncbi:MAG: hypothetical protein RSE14_03690 [Erythrobacter sp.]|uniref:hypothetical protein n=1 Tax=Erythrobacter sp. TaxID=1042 RepID=UPI002B46C6E8|nr:hypothetical protein [Erythrobacter sp.]WRH71209.1 MAG: hypothetical protein RSE14_03690 [Erythrobacter sp.]